MTMPLRDPGGRSKRLVFHAGIRRRSLRLSPREITRGVVRDSTTQDAKGAFSLRWEYAYAPRSKRP